MKYLHKGGQIVSHKYLTSDRSLSSSSCGRTKVSGQQMVVLNTSSRAWLSTNYACELSIIYDLRASTPKIAAN